MPTPCWTTTPCPLSRGSGTTKWRQLFPLRLREPGVGRRSPARGNAVDLFQFMTSKKPGRAQVKKRRAAEQGQKSQQLYQETRVHGELCVVHPEPGRHTHNCRT